MGRHNDTDPGRPPVIEVCLGRAYQAFQSLVAARRTIIAAGVAPDAAPGDDALRAYSILGDFERARIVEQLEPHYPTLQAKGLIHADLSGASTPELRLLASITDHLDALLGIRERFEEGLSAAGQGSLATGNGPRISCAAAASGTWGQPARVNFGVTDGEWIMIRPDPVFGVGEALFRTGAADFQGRFDIPVDDGAVLLAAMAANGEVNAHRLRVRTVREAI